MNALRTVPKKGLKTTGMLGKPVSDFSLAATGGTTFQLCALRRAKVVLYFYPKDNTPGCTVEGADFRDLPAQFRRAGARVFGISRDSVASHERFKEKMRFPFELLSDPDEAVCGRFGVMKDKVMYGKKVRGIPKGLRGVKVPGHAQEVLNFVKAL